MWYLNVMNFIICVAKYMFAYDIYLEIGEVGIWNNGN